MQQGSTEERLRRLFLAVAAFIFVGTILELLLLEHTEEPLQWVPLVVSGIGLLTVAAVWVWPGEFLIRALRWLMVAVIVSGFIGMYLHFRGNLAFSREINPSFTFTEALWPAIKGSYPLLAPGILLVAGILGLAGTYRHPVLQSHS